MVAMGKFEEGLNHCYNNGEELGLPADYQADDTMTNNFWNAAICNHFEQGFLKSCVNCRVVKDCLKQYQQKQKEYFYIAFRIIPLYYN